MSLKGVSSSKRTTASTKYKDASMKDLDLSSITGLFRPLSLLTELSVFNPIINISPSSADFREIIYMAKVNNVKHPFVNTILFFKARHFPSC